MILDIIYIIASLFARMSNNNNLVKTVQNMTFERYLEAPPEKNDNIDNPCALCSVFSDSDAVESVFKD